MLRHSCFGRFLVAAGLLVSSQIAPVDAALLVYEPFEIGGGPSQYLAGNDSTGTNVLGGQNPTTGPAPF